jgi:hypothetical protein
MRSLRIILAAAAIPAASAALAAGPLGSASDASIFGREPGKEKAYACYTRVYDKAHLAGHPKQNTRDMTLFVKSYVDSDPDVGRQYELTLGVHFRQVKALSVLGGGCSPSGDGKGTLNCAIDCDGGAIDVSVKNATSIHVSIPEGARTWDPESGAEPPAKARFGADDKLFRLDKATLATCLPIISDDETRAEIAAIK